MNRRIKCQSYNRITGMICGRPATREAKVEINSADGKIWETLDVCQPHAVAMRAELVKTINGLNAQLDVEIEYAVETGIPSAERAIATDLLNALRRAEKALVDLDQRALTIKEAQKAERAEIARRDRVEIMNLIARMGR
jgi:hypothetical protein